MRRSRGVRRAAIGRQMALTLAECGLGRLFMDSIPIFIEGVAPDAVIAHNAGDQSAHLSDVFDVISANDPTFGAGAADALPRDNMAQPPAPYAYIIEQPAPKSLRFRYECEGRSAGSIPGINSTTDNKTFPTIKICGYKGCMVIVVSCVTKDEPYKPHPHNLVGRDCQMGVCTVKVKTEGDQDSCHVMFKNLGIQCVKRRDIPEALRVRRELRVNPFKTSYSYQNQTQSIDLNAVRLCFQVFLTDDMYKVQRALASVVSDVIYDKKAMSELLIVRTSHCAGSVKGGTTIILLCEKVTREDTEVWFYREEKGVTVWQERGHIDFVHKQLAIVLKTPPYADQRINEHVTVQIQLQRLSDQAKSNAFNFEYFPEAQDKDVILGRKRQKKFSYTLSDYEGSPEMAIKAEPRADRTPPHQMGAAAYGDQQWRMDAPGSSAMAAAQAAYAAQLSWASPGYAHAASPLAPLAPLAPPEPHPAQVMSPEAQAGSPLHHPGSPYAMHMVSPHQHMHQAQQGMHLQQPNMGMRSPLAPSVSPAMSPNMMHVSPGLPPSVSPGMAASMPANMPVNMQGGMLGMQLNMDPVMGEAGQPQPIYAQMDTSSNSTPSLSTLLAHHGEEEPAFTSGDLTNFLLSDRADLSDSLNRLSTRDLLQP